MRKVLLRTLVAITCVIAPAVIPSGSLARPLKLSVGAAIQTDNLDWQLARNIRCIVDTIYTEARGEDEYAQAMVAYVVVARAKDKRPEWGSTPCEVAYRIDVRKGKVVSQFSGNIHHPVQLRFDDPKLQAVIRVAIRVLLGYWVPNPKHACTRAYQNVKDADPNRQDWFSTLRNIGNIGKHTFYCLPERARTASLKK